MLRAVLAVLSLPLLASAQAPFLPTFQSTLSNLGFGRFADAIKNLSTTSTGSELLASLGSSLPYTVYVPVNEAWDSIGNVDLAKVLAYHISPSSINTTDIAPPRRHTIAYTELRQDQALPGRQPQVLVLETSPVNDTRVLIRGADWNTTSRGNGTAYGNIWLQPIDRVLSPPLPLLDVLRHPLDSSAVNGTTAALALINNVGLQDTFTGCKGCTFFIPNDAALAGINFDALVSSQRANVLLGHVINGDVRYSTELDAGDTWISAAGQTVAYGVNATGAFITSGGAIARIVRSDILCTNGVVHLVNRVIGGPIGNPDRAASALTAASVLAATQTTADGIIGRIPTSIPISPTSSTPPGSSQSRASARRRISSGFWMRWLHIA